MQMGWMLRGNFTNVVITKSIRALSFRNLISSIFTTRKKWRGFFLRGVGKLFRMERYLTLQRLQRPMKLSTEGS